MLSALTSAMLGAYVGVLYHERMRYLGIDYGTKKVGLALSDEAGRMGFPHAVVANTPRLVEEVAALIATKNVGAVVLGESRDFTGRENPVASAARAFAKHLGERAGVPVFFEPEVFTSAEARRQHEGTEKTRAPRQTRGARVDASAAALILTSYLSRC